MAAQQLVNASIGQGNAPWSSESRRVPTRHRMELPLPSPDLTAPHQSAMVPGTYLQHRTVPSVPCPGLNWSGLESGVVRGISLEGGVVNRTRRGHRSEHVSRQGQTVSSPMAGPTPDCCP